VRFIHAAAIGIALLAITAPAPVAAQTTAAKLTTKASKSWTPPRIADGHPDLRGYWTNATLIPVERPVELGNKEFYTEAEATAMDKERIQRENSQAKTDIHYDNVIWQHENYKKVASTRTSLIFDPPNGRVPPLSAAGQKRAVEEKEAARRWSQTQPISPIGPTSAHLPQPAGRTFSQAGTCTSWNASRAPIPTPSCTGSPSRILSHGPGPGRESF
jgi:hypothetical protein